MNMTPLQSPASSRAEQGSLPLRWGATPRWLILIATGISLMVLSQGCSVLRAPGKAVHAITPGTKSANMEPAEVENLVQRLADEYSLRTGQALDEYARLRGTPEAASEALRWKVVVLTYSMRIASAPNPYENLVDMTAVISLNRSALEDYWIHTAHGEAFAPWLESSRVLETNVWQAAATVFTSAQVNELRQAIDRYRREHTNVVQPLFTRPQEFASSLRLAAAKSESQTSLFGFIGLDATMGLDPAVQEVTRTRLFAERAMFTVQRLPTLTRLQAEILSDDLLHKPELQQTLTNTTRLAESADRISRAAESLSQTAAGLPDRISAERKEILAALEDHQGKLGNLAAELNQTLVSAEKMSTSLNATLITFDALMKRFGVGEPKTNAVASNGSNTRPFDVLDYARTAQELAVATRELDVLLKDLGSTLDSPGWNERLRDVSAVSRQTSEDAKSVLNHAFLLGAGLILLTLVCAVVYRRTTPRREPVDRGDE